MDECNKILTQDFVSNSEPQEQLFIKDAILQSLSKYRDSANIYHKRAMQMYEFMKNTIVTEEPCVFHGMKWTSDSCYIDSVLMCILAVPDALFDRLLETDVMQSGGSCDSNEQVNSRMVNSIRGELRNIRQFIRDGVGKNDCTKLRELFAKCSSLRRFIREYNDAGEFLTSLFGIFSELNVCTKTMERNYTEDITTPLENMKQIHLSKTSSSTIVTSPEQYVENFFISDSAPSFHTSDFVEKVSQETIKPELMDAPIRRIIKEAIFETPYLVFNIQRLGGNNNFNTKIIIPDELIYIKSGSILELTGIVMFIPSHYICFFSCRKTWYYYNDLSPENERIRQLGTYNEMLEKYGDYATQTGTLYFYSKLFNSLA